MDNRWTIYAKGGGERCVTDSLELHAEWMSDCYLTVSVKSPIPIDFQFGDYVDYRGERFTINYDPNVLKRAKTFGVTDPDTGMRIITGGAYGEGFIYDNIKMYSSGYVLKTVGFKDIVLYDNGVPYTSLSTFSFFAGSIEDMADRLQANLDRAASGWVIYTPNWPRTSQRSASADYGIWGSLYPSLASDSEHRYSQGDATLGETDVNIDIDGIACSDVLKFAYEKFGLAYYVKDSMIVIGSDPVKVNSGQHIFRYGKNNGLYEIERTSDEDQEIVTKLFAYGSEQNLPLNYYANLHKRAYFVIDEKEEDPWSDNLIGSDEVYYALKSSILFKNIEASLTDSEHICTISDGTSSVQAVCLTTSIEGEGYHTGFVFYKSKDPGNEAFFKRVSEGQSIYVVGGVNINLWTQEYIENDSDYPYLLSINRLMLPGFPDQSLDAWVQAKISSSTGQEKAQWETIYAKYIFSTDKHDPWIMSANNSEIGLHESTVVYDGSSQKEIYPTIENTGGNTLYRGSWGDSGITDNGYIGDETDDKFKVAVYRGEGYLDWGEAMSTATDEVKMEMKSGFCTGRAFKVDKNPQKVEITGKQGNVLRLWVLTMHREKDESLQRYFPYLDNVESGYCLLQEGDKYVVTGIEMPKEYIDAAAEKLFIAACGYLDKRDHMRYTYVPKVDEIFMARQHDSVESGSYHDILRAGMQLEFEDTDLGIWHSPFIDVLTIHENGNNGIPTYDVVLRDEKEKGALEKLADTIADLQHPVIAPTERQTKKSRDVQYDEWDPNGKYYYQTLNPVPFEGETYIETSYVWHKGCLWMCLRSLTKEEPWFTSQDWKCVSKPTSSLRINVLKRLLRLSDFSDSKLATTLSFVLMIGDNNLTESVDKDSVVWTRQSVGAETDPAIAAADESWNQNYGYHKLVIPIYSRDLPSNFWTAKEVQFTCTVTIDWIDDSISRSITLH